MSQTIAKNFYQVVKTAPKGRYKGIKRNYEVEDLLKLRGSIDIDNSGYSNPLQSDMIVMGILGRLHTVVEKSMEALEKVF